MPRYHESCRLLGISPIYNDVMMTATTNKAAEVLGKATGRQTKTVHSFLSLKVTDNYETGTTKLTKTRSWTVHRNQILFVDEASMIDTSLHQLIREGTSQSKIIYVGDHCQLAPVMEKISPIYRANLPFYELTEPMRNAERPALMAICNQLRETVETGKFRPIKIVPGVIDLLEGPEMEAEIRSHFMDPTNHDRILAYTNARVMDYNDYIRQMKGLPPTLTKGEHVINNSAIQFGQDMMSVEDEFIVTDVSPSTSLIELSPGVSLEVVFCSLTGTQKSFRGVPVPVNRDHFSQLVKYYANKKDWPKYFKLKNGYPDLRPRDAATVHKAQGSTYNTVFIDLKDLSTCHVPAMAARLLYVAFSRAKHRVVLWGNLASKYGGLVT
jgi:hypothetical protein